VIRRTRDRLSCEICRKGSRRWVEEEGRVLDGVEMRFVERTACAMEVVGGGTVLLVLLRREWWRSTMEVTIYSFLEKWSVVSGNGETWNAQSSARGKGWDPSPN
jgi:hypothetical protein